MTRVKLFHRTTRGNAARILRCGFEDRSGSYGTAVRHRGVWLSTAPLTENEGASGDVLLAIEMSISEPDLSEHEWLEDGKPYREFLLPAAVVNARGALSVAELDWFEILRRTKRRPPVGWAALE
jgi:hypothetical protein